MNDKDKFLGMDHSITRRDFLQGVALSIAASRLGSAQTTPLTSYPPLLHGLRGQDPSSTDLGHRIRDAKTEIPTDVVDTGERYDLVVIGAGLAGLCSSYVYRRERSSAHILLLDNQDDFGGHARRNTFEWNGTTLIAPGGTFALESPEDSPRGAKEIMESLEIDLEVLEGYRDRDFFKRYGLSYSVFFDPRTYPGIQPTWVNQFYDIPYREFFRRSGIPEDAQRELVNLYTTRRMYITGRDREATLAGTTWEQFIREVMGLGDNAVRFANLYSTDLVGLGCDAVSALDGFEIGPGFSGMGGPGFVDRNGIPRYGYRPVHRFPDGNHTIARHLLKKILPAAVPGEDTMEGIFNSRVRYDQLDRSEHRVRVRLRSLAIRVEQIENGRRVAVYYTQPDGRVQRVTAPRCDRRGLGNGRKAHRARAAGGTEKRPRTVSVLLGALHQCAVATLTPHRRYRGIPNAMAGRLLHLDARLGSLAGGRLPTGVPSGQTNRPIDVQVPLHAGAPAQRSDEARALRNGEQVLRRLRARDTIRAESCARPVGLRCGQGHPSYHCQSLGTRLQLFPTDAR